MIMGHELSGVISEVGSMVKHLVAGDRVVPYPMVYCGKSSSCTAGNTQFCAEKRQLGVLTVDGGFAEYLCVPAKVCYKLHDDVSYCAGRTVESLAVGFRGVKHAGDLADKTILVVGSGTIGLMIVACAKIQNPSSAGKYR